MKTRYRKHSALKNTRGGRKKMTGGIHSTRLFWQGTRTKRKRKSYLKSKKY